MFRAFHTFPSLKFRLEYSKSIVDCLEKYVKSNDVLIHLHGDRSIISYEIVRRFAGRTPLVIQHHGSGGEVFPYSHLERVLFPLADWFFVLTKEKQRYLQSCGVNPSRISINTMGVDTSCFKPISKRWARDKLGLPKEKELILYVGRLERNKGIEKIAKAVLSLKSSRNLELIAVGASRTDSLFPLLKHAPIKLIPRVSHAMMPLYYNAANLLVLLANPPMLRYGGITVSVAEALACNTPVVSNTLLNLPRRLTAQVGEIPATEKDLGPCILKVLEHETNYGRGRSIAKRFFDWGVVVGKISRIYDILLEDFSRIQWGS